ncbi:MAG: GGDEF domain-containing protein [Treponema sp.]|nr:GGDEF domain-containing protein [Treponema sp.]
MSLPNILNIFFGSALIIVVILAECSIKYSGDRILKNIFCTFLAITLLSLVMDLLLTMFNAATINIFAENAVIRYTINVLPVIISISIVIYLSKMRKNINQLIIVLLSLFAVSMSFNIFTGSIKAIWPVMAALLLFTYLYIILKENKTDNLTGLGNRYSFFEFFTKISRNKTGESWAVAMLDINNFKSINDIYGHLEGDNALRNFAQVIKNCAKKTDFYARYGGDEFILLTKAENDIKALVAQIENELINLNEKSEKPYNISICCGYDNYTADGNQPIDEFLTHIDKFMHKHNKENRRVSDRVTGGIDTGRGSQI